MIIFDVINQPGAGLEVRVPFLDKDFLDYYMSIKPKMKMPESYHMKSIYLEKLSMMIISLPKEVLWRVKEAMSDGVSIKKEVGSKLFKKWLIMK